MVKKYVRVFPPFLFVRKVLKINMKQEAEIFQNVPDTPQKTANTQLHSSVSPFKKPNTFLIGKRKKYILVTVF